MRLTSAEQTLVEGWEWAITQARSADELAAQ